MYSPGSSHQRIPRDIQANLAWRKHVLTKCRDKKKYRHAVIDACRKDIFFFINTFIWQINPNFIPGGTWSEYGPFITVAYQDRAIRVILDCIFEREDLLIQKSREMGVTWFCLIVQVWIWLFHKRKQQLCLSRNEESVDKPGDPNSLFWKIDYMLGFLPKWLLQGYVTEEQSTEEKPSRNVRKGRKLPRRKRSFTHPNGSGVTGQATTAAAGVGGRALDAFVDEFPRFPNGGFDVLAGTAETTACRIFNGTHQGVDTAFYQLSTRVDIRKLTIHWSEHPDKRAGLYHWSKEHKRIVSLDPGYEYPPQCSKCLKLYPKLKKGDPSPCEDCRGSLIQDYKFITDGTPLGGPFPGIRSPWYDRACRRMGSPHRVAEELDINPIGSATQAFDAGVIMELIGTWARPHVWEGDLEYDTQTAEPKRLTPRKGGPIRLWIRPDAQGQVPFGKYKFGIDVSNGLGKTPSCVTITDSVARKVIGEIVVAHVQPTPFAAMMVAMARLFCQEAKGMNERGEGAEMLWEGAGPGVTFGKTVTVDLNYRNVYWRVIEQKFMPKRRADTPGWVPSPENKDHLLRDYGHALQSRELHNPSEASLKEALLFKIENGHIVHPLEKGVNDPSGAKYNHGDLCQSAAMCWKLVKEADEARPASERPKKEPDENSLDGRMRIWERTRRTVGNWFQPHR